MAPVLSDSSRALTVAGDVRPTLERLTRTLVPRLADFCCIFLLAGDELQCVAQAHVTRQGLGLLQRLNRIYRIKRNDPQSTTALVVRTGQPQLRVVIQPEPQTARPSRAIWDLHRRLAVRSALVVPIVAQQTVLGSLTLCRAEPSGRTYAADDVPAATEIATRIAEAIDEARLLNAARRHASLDRKARPVLTQMRHCLTRLRAGVTRDERLRLLGEVARQERILERLFDHFTPLLAPVPSLRSGRSRARL